MTPQEMYLELLKRTVLNTIYKDPNFGPHACEYDDEKRRLGHSCPSLAHTMIGRVRLDNVHEALQNAVENNIPGDFIETGVWRGGTTIFAQGFFKVHKENRNVWVADSFAGLPPPDPKYPVDKGSTFHEMKFLNISIEEVQENFRRYDLLDYHVKFLKGWFKDTLPKAPIEKLCALRLDGDMYESTMDALNALYDKVSPGGYVIIDDYWLSLCRQAVDDFRKLHSITETIIPVDWTGVYWIKK